MKIRRMNGKVLEICDEKENLIMSVAESLKNSVISISVSGEIRNDVAHEFEDEVMAAFSVCPVIEIDLSQTTYIASLALKALLSVQQIVDETDGTSMTVLNLSPEVKRIFEESGFIDILCVEER